MLPIEDCKNFQAQKTRTASTWDRKMFITSYLIIQKFEDDIHSVPYYVITCSYLGFSSLVSLVGRKENRRIEVLRNLKNQWESEHPTRCARSELRRVSICLWIRGSFLGLSLFASRRISERRISVGTNDGAGEAVFSIRHDSQSSSSSGLAYDLPIFVPKEYALKFKHCFSELWVNGAMVQMN